MEFKINEIVHGANVGIFRIKEFHTIGDLEGVIMKEVHPETLEDGPHPELWHSFDMIRKLTLADLTK